MSKLIRQALIYGFVTGTLLFVIAPLGLGIAMIEFLRPILVPGIGLLQLFWQSPAGAVVLVSGLLLNGVIYSMLFLSISLLREQAFSRNTKLLTAVLVTLVFLAATGMLTNIYLLLVSPDKSWIFQIGA